MRSEKEQKALHEEVVAFRDAAVADGWSIEPTYGEHESVDRASRLKKDGFLMMILTRTPVEGDFFRHRYESEVSIWGPDGLCIAPPSKYDMEEIRRGLRICEECHATDVETFRVSFAGRCCAKCLPAARKIHEYPGWTK